MTWSCTSLGAMGEEREADAGGGHGEVPAHPGVDRHGASSGDAFHEDDLGSFTDGELNVLAGDLREVLQEGEGPLAKALASWGERAELPEPKTHVVVTVGLSLEGSPVGQLADQAMGRG